MLQLAVPLRGFDRTRPPPDVRPDSYFVIQAPPALNSAVSRSFVYMYLYDRYTYSTTAYEIYPSASRIKPLK